MFYSKAELLEVSIVTIPANGEATMLEQKFYNAIKEEILREVKEVIQDNLIVNKSNEDRQNLKNELEKIEIYSRNKKKNND